MCRRVVYDLPEIGILSIFQLTLTLSSESPRYAIIYTPNLLMHTMEIRHVAIFKKNKFFYDADTDNDDRRIF